MSIQKTDSYPFRAPKKYPEKDLHGRPRVMQLQYNDFKRFQKFYVNVFGWDMFELPETAGGAKKGSDHPTVVCATGPSYETWEGLNPGHMNCTASYTPDKVAPPTMFMEIHMDRPVAETVGELVKYGGSYDGELPEETESWAASCYVKDPSSNLLFLWKCPPSRTWEEPECGYDTD